ncbi:hypothetical protein ANACOL_02369 [Anaerotruncus colihominis DSM 17241]|uniref:Uncharacterized protein n=1 Tax=Anaerotruncus colihominis DSM 17241 TaxID=445972 RepID=B0PC60_9FIRM|nr:hypothetical protein ANACOL_02369 [Anaerotruncus colihominis DSM 17241]
MKKSLGKKLLTFFEKKVSQKTLVGCAPAFLKKSLAKNFSRLRRKQWDRSRYFYRLRRELRGGRSAYTGCACPGVVSTG